MLPPEPTDHDITDIVVPVHQEDITISRRVVAGDVVRVSTVTEEREHAVDEPVFHERVEVEHVAIGREIEAVPEIVQDGDVTIIPVVEEVLVVQRRLVLKEELHIRRVRETSRHHEVVLLRQQKAVVTRTPGEAKPAGSAIHDQYETKETL
jgi:stress response protein YsnF